MVMSCEKTVMSCEGCHRSEDAALLARFVSALGFVLPVLALSVSHVSSYSLLLYSCLLSIPRFGAGYGLYGVLWWKRGLDMVMRAGLPAPALCLEEVRRIAARGWSDSMGLCVRIELRDERTAGDARSAAPMESRFSADCSPQFRTVQSAALDNLSK